MRSHLLTRAALAAALLLLPAAAQAQTPLTVGEWTTFEWFDGVGSFAEPSDGFFLAVLQPVRIRLTDAFESGDVFELFVNGVQRLTTAAVADGVVGAEDGESAWNDTNLSHGALDLGAGSYVLSVRVQRTAAGYDYGAGFLRADLTNVSTVPEPATLLLVGSGAAGLVAARRRRRDRSEG